MTKESAFLDYYNKKGIIPTSQPINVNHFRRRNYLLSTLGINLSSLRQSKIIEFGPGGGFNAQAICKWNPAQYTLVDASKESLKILEKKKKCGEIFAGYGNSDSVKIVNSTILTFESNELFDLVIVEGLIPGQTHPEDILRCSSSFTDLGGIYITTAKSGASLLSETCRRIFMPYIESEENDFDSQVNLAVTIFTPQLKTLGNNLRPVKDWVLDNILHKYSKENKHIFTLSDVISTLGEDFQFHGSSPRFLIDDRFYKHVSNSRFGVNEIFLKQYDYMNIPFIDYRVPMNNVFDLDLGICRDIEDLCKHAWDVHLNICGDLSYESLEEFLSIIKEVEDLLPESFNITKNSIKNFRTSFPIFIENQKSVNFSNFNSWWGRAQQYISLIRNP